VKNRGIRLCGEPAGVLLLLSAQKFPLHCREVRGLFFFARLRVFEPGESLAHEFWTLPAVRQILFGHAAVIDRAAVNANKGIPEGFAPGLTAPRAHFSLMVAVAAGVPAHGLDLLCHTYWSEYGVINSRVWTMKVIVTVSYLKKLSVIWNISAMKGNSVFTVTSDVDAVLPRVLAFFRNLDYRPVFHVDALII